MSKERTESPGETRLATSCRALVKVPGITKLEAMVGKRPVRSTKVLDQIAEPAQAFWITWHLEVLTERRPEGGTLWILCRDVTQQDRLANELPVWTSQPVLYFPQYDAVHFEGAQPDPETASERLQTLHALGRPADQWRAVLMHHESLEETVPALGALEREELQIEVGTAWDLQELAEKLQCADFDRVPQVFERGQYAQRGGILDIFPWQATDPVRIEFFDRDVESIRFFDIDAQTSVRALDRTSLLLKDEGDDFSLFSAYIAKTDCTLAIECGDEEALSIKPQLRLTEFSAKAMPTEPAWASTDGPIGEFHAGDFVLQEARRGQFEEQLAAWAAEDWRICMFFNNRGEEDRFKELISPKALEQAGVRFCEGRLAKGFTVPHAKLAILTDAEIFGRYQHGRTQRLFKRVSRQRKAANSDFAQLRGGNPSDGILQNLMMPSPFGR